MLAENPGVVEVAVVGAPDLHRREIVRAHVVMRDASPFDEDAAHELCRSRLAAYKVPAEFLVDSQLPRNAAGKILKRQLRASTDAETLHQR